MKIISGSSNTPFAKNLASHLELPIIDCKINRFSNGEKRVWIKGDVRGNNITLVQSFSNPVDENIIETLLIVDALERMGARNINLVIPWMGYSLQDKVFRSGEPISAKVIANLISQTYISRVFLLDLHNKSIPGFFSVPTQYLTANDLYVQYVKDNFDLQKAVIASPDFGGLKRARDFSKDLNIELVNIDKTRDLDSGEVTADKLHGNVSNKDVLIFDDVIVSGSTVIESARILKENGASSVHFMATHGIFTGSAIENLEQSQIDSVVITNSIYHTNLSGKIKILDSSPIFAETIRNWI